MPPNNNRNIDHRQSRRAAKVTAESRVDFGPPEFITDITFEDSIASLKATGMLPMPQRGADGHYSIRRYQVKNPAYITRVTQTEVDQAFNDGADIVVCINDRQVFIAPDTPYTPDRSMRFCRCAEDSPKCHCWDILNFTTPDAGFADNLINHVRLSKCVDQNVVDDGSDLYTAMVNNHDWWDGEDSPAHNIAAASLKDRTTKILDTCRRCGKFRATTHLLPFSYSQPTTTMDSAVIDMEAENEPFAAWLHDATTGQMVPCTYEQYFFATKNTHIRAASFPLI